MLSIEWNKETAPVVRNNGTAVRPPIYRVIALASVLLAVLTAAYTLHSIQKNDGHFVYIIDDAFIHLAIAKSFALYSNWGVTRYAFSFSTSSPLWTLLLTTAFVSFGVSIWTAFVLNVVFAIALVVVSAELLRRCKLTEREIGATLLIVIIAVPLPVIVICGMEHTVQALLALLYLFAVADLISSDSTKTPMVAKAITLATLLCMSRYEGLFLLAPSVFLLVVRHRLFIAALISSIALTPLVALAVFSLHHGWGVLPNSVVIKGNVVGFWRNVSSVERLYRAVRLPIDTLIGNEVILILGLLSGGLLILALQRQGIQSLKDAPTVRLMLYLATLLIHVAVGRVGSFYRYEAYLLVLGIVIIASSLREPWCESLMSQLRLAFVGNRPVGAIVLIILFAPFLARAHEAFNSIAGAAHNTYEVHYQIARFLVRNYQHQEVALTDIGAPTFFCDFKLLDLGGLASIDVAHALETARFNTRTLGGLVQHAGAKIVINSGFRLDDPGIGGAPIAWTKVGEWGVYDPIVLPVWRVEFYATDASQVELLKKQVRLSCAMLPKSMSCGTL